MISFFSILVLCLLVGIISYGIGHDRGYRDGYDQGVMSGGFGARNIIDHINRKKK